MLVAVSNKNDYINAMNEQKNIKQKTEYFCPNCKEPVFLKKGLIKQAHFTHPNLFLVNWKFICQI